MDGEWKEGHHTRMQTMKREALDDREAVMIDLEP
jgi:hypothetical protein